MYVGGLYWTPLYVAWLARHARGQKFKSSRAHPRNPPDNRGVSVYISSLLAVLMLSQLAVEEAHFLKDETFYFVGKAAAT